VGMAGQVTQLGLMLNVHLTPHPVVGYRSAAVVRKPSSRLVRLAPLNRGIFAAPRDMFRISTRMDSLVVDDTFSQFTDALKEVRPVVERGD